MHFALLRSCFGAPSWRAQAVSQQPARALEVKTHDDRIQANPYPDVNPLRENKKKALTESGVQREKRPPAASC
jgi:hypothetical protein